VSSYGPEGLFEVHLERDPQKRVTTTHGEEPRVVVWNELGLVERLMLPDGSVLDEVAYSDEGLVIAQANGAGEGWKYWYDDRGRRIRAKDPCQQITAYDYEGESLSRVIGPDGHVTQLAYDGKGSLSAIEYPWGETYFLKYDPRGRVVETTGNCGLVARYEYDDQNNVVAETDGRGARTIYRYDGMGRPIAMCDALGRETRVAYDALGRRLSISRPDGAMTQFSYDAAGHLARIVDSLGRATQYVHSGLNALSKVVGPDGRAWTIEYTSDERIKKIVNPLGEAYSFDRDLAGRVVAETTFDGRTLRYERDGAGRVARVVFPDGTDRSFAYDRAGRLALDKTREDARIFARDPLGRLVSAVVESVGGRDEIRFERDGFGRVLAEARGARRVRYDVDAMGRRTQRVLPNGAATRYAYDASSRLSAVDHDGFTLDFERDELGRETARSNASGLRLTSAYDAGDRLVERRATAPGADGSIPRVLTERRWRYDRIGRVERIDDSRWGATTYAYDAQDRLLEVAREPAREAFSYDASGSILTALEDLDGGRRVLNAELAPGNVLLRAGDTTYAYDDRGRRVRKVRHAESGAPEVTEYAWDGRDQLTGAALPDGTRVAFTYDALGRRVHKTLSPPASRPRSVEYLWDGNVLALELDSEAGPRAFVHVPGTFVPLLQQEGGEVFACVVDHLGTPKELLTRDGLVAWSAAHSAWGKVVAQSADPQAKARYGRVVASPFRLLGQIADDELGLCFTRYRLFDPEVGRWTSADPKGIAGGTNLFAFDGAPSVVVDPWGLTTTGAAGGSHPAKFATAEEAAVDAMQKTNPQSIKENTEYGAWVHKNPDGTFSSAPPTKGTIDGLGNMPAKGPDDVAWWHTHGGPDPGYDSENFSGATGDKGYSKYYNAPGYVATPSGAIKKYDPSTDTVTTLPQTTKTS
jgi:RHS repeat-associated protein